MNITGQILIIDTNLHSSALYGAAGSFKLNQFISSPGLHNAIDGIATENFTYTKVDFDASRNWTGVIFSNVNVYKQNY